MKKQDRWDKPDWGNEEPVKFKCLQMHSRSIFTAILLGGITIAVVLAGWYLAG